jgi:energy-coupling factor transporter ATP-binding protein EcfA2
MTDLESIEDVGRPTAWAGRRPAEMSGGQAQRFAIARALATRPAIVWADEPTGALDSVTGNEVIELMLRLNAEHGLTFVWVTHAGEVAARASQIVSMRDGQIDGDRTVEPASHRAPDQAPAGHPRPQPPRRWGSATVVAVLRNNSVFTTGELNQDAAIASIIVPLAAVEHAFSGRYHHTITPNTATPCTPSNTETDGARDCNFNGSVALPGRPRQPDDDPSASEVRHDR